MGSGFNHSLVFKTFAILFWFFPIHVQLKGDSGTYRVPIIKIREPLPLALFSEATPTCWSTGPVFSVTTLQKIRLLINFSCLALSSALNWSPPLEQNYKRKEEKNRFFFHNLGHTGFPSFPGQKYKVSIKFQPPAAWPLCRPSSAHGQKRKREWKMGNSFPFTMSASAYCSEFLRSYFLCFVQGFQLQLVGKRDGKGSLHPETKVGLVFLDQIRYFIMFIFSFPFLTSFILSPVYTFLYPHLLFSIILLILLYSIYYLKLNSYLIYIVYMKITYVHVYKVYMHCIYI